MKGYMIQNNAIGVTFSADSARENENLHYVVPTETSGFDNMVIP